MDSDHHRMHGVISTSQSFSDQAESVIFYIEISNYEADNIPTEENYMLNYLEYIYGQLTRII